MPSWWADRRVRQYWSAPESLLVLLFDASAVTRVVIRDAPGQRSVDSSLVASFVANAEVATGRFWEMDESPAVRVEGHVMSGYAPTFR